MRLQREQDDFGFVLVAVLWILAALATLASIYSAYASTPPPDSMFPTTGCRLRPPSGRASRWRRFGSSRFPEPVRPSQGGFSLRVGRTNVAVRFRSEGARIDLNAAPEDLLAGLFAAVGVDPASAKAFADRVIGWRTKARPERQFQGGEALCPIARALSAAPGAVRGCFGAQSSARIAGAGRRARPALRHRIQRPPDRGRRQRRPDGLVRAARHDACDPDRSAEGSRRQLGERKKDLLALLGPAVSRASVDRPKAIRAAIDVGLR